MPDVDFGTIAVAIAETFATNPWTEDGLPAEGAHVLMPVGMVLKGEPPTPAPAPAPAH